MMKQFFVTIDWDDEANVWYVADTDVPGLAAEAATIDLLREKVLQLVPLLVEENAHLIQGEDFSDLVRLCVESTFSIERPRAA